MNIKNIPENWKDMTREQKREWRLNKFLNPDNVEFISARAKAAYQTRAKRMIDAFSLEEPDRVPVYLPAGNIAYNLYGINMRTAMYDPAKAVEACKYFNEKYSAELEHFASPMAIPAKILEILDYRQYAWPGYGITEDAPGYQFKEDEYMKPEEYDDLIRDPSDFWMRTYLPRILGALEPFRMFQPLTNIIEMPVSQLMVLGNPEVKKSLRKLLDVCDVLENRSKILAAYNGSGPANGYPASMGTLYKAPFDILGDTLRGTVPIMKDLFKRPDKILDALDVITDLSIHSLLNSRESGNSYMITFPLHKGADGWMSQKQFEKFYWPGLKKVMDALIDEGFIVNLFAEGAYDTRLESVNEFPKGSVCWWFDQTDIFRAKKILGDKCSIQGNIPSSLIVTGSPADVKAYCKKLIEGCGKGGGYILGAGCIADNPKLENLRAIVEAANEYGTYRK